MSTAEPNASHNTLSLLETPNSSSVTREQPTRSVLSPADTGIKGEGKALLFPLVEMLPQVGGEQAADAAVRDENVKVVQQASLGLIWFVLFLQDTVWDNLLQVEGKGPPVVCTIGHLPLFRTSLCFISPLPLTRFSLRSPPASSCRISASALTSFWARL